MVTSLVSFYFLKQGQELVIIIAINRRKIEILSIYIFVDGWTTKAKERKEKRRPIIEEIIGNIECHTSF